MPGRTYRWLLLLSLAGGLCACEAAPPPDLPGRWARRGYATREWIDFKQDSTFEIHSFMEYPDSGEVIPGIYRHRGDSIYLTSSFGITSGAYLLGEDLILRGHRFERVALDD